MAPPEQEPNKGNHGRREDSTPSYKSKNVAILEPGQVLNNSYEIVEQIGEGGMAIVYKARQRSLGRFVAIKALHPKLARDQEFIERFEAESGALAALSHPNVINIIDRGSENAVYFFVMEFVDGEDLDQKIIENKLTPNDWRTVVQACASALDYVHKRGVVHRDIKPSNILVDSEGRVKIGDFGIAHIIAGDGGDAGAKSPQRAVGTAHYMAPEQINDSGNVDHRADIFSLGVAFYKMMTRQLPVGEFPAPSEVNHDVPIAVDEVIFRSLSPDRNDRYSSVQEMCEELIKALKDQSMSITSILNYRGGKAGSSLYSGADFSRTQGTGSSSEVKKPSTDTGRRTPSTAGVQKLKTPTTKDKKKTSSGSNRVTASKDLTPLPVNSQKNEGAAAPHKSNFLMILFVVFLVLAGVGIIVIAMINAKEPPPPPTADQLIPITDTRSDALEREDRLRKKREDEIRASLEGTIREEEVRTQDTSTQGGNE